MRVQLTQQAQESLGQSDLVIITERVDDVALLIGQMVKMGLVEVLDRHLPRHWKQRRVSWGWTAVIWLAYILTEGDHRKVSVEAYITGMHHTLSHLSGQRIEPLDFSDDRLSHLLTHLSNPTYWHAIEQDLNACSIEVHALSQDVIRCDATTVSGDHDVTDGGLLQFGHSKDDPTRPQIKVMIGSLDPLGMPLATDVLSGERADDGLYIPLIDRIVSGLHRPALLFVGDCKMSALATRAYLAQRAHLYLSPLPLTGATAEARRTGSPRASGRTGTASWHGFSEAITASKRCWRPRGMRSSGVVVWRMGKVGKRHGANECWCCARPCMLRSRLQGSKSVWPRRRKSSRP